MKLFTVIITSRFGSKRVVTLPAWSQAEALEKAERSLEADESIEACVQRES